MALDQVAYNTRETQLGRWRTYEYGDGRRFAEFRSHVEIGGWPLIHYTYGICPETGRRIIARGIIAIGRMAVGVVAIGQAAAGVLALGQAAVGVLGALGQGAAGYYCVGQMALGIGFGLGQLATGATAIGQLALGRYVLAQQGWGRYVWTQSHADPAAVEYFKALLETLKALF